MVGSALVGVATVVVVVGCEVVGVTAVVAVPVVERVAAVVVVVGATDSVPPPHAEVTSSAAKTTMHFLTFSVCHHFANRREVRYEPQIRAANPATGQPGRG